jgi:hypothetical protein
MESNTYSILEDEGLDHLTAAVEKLAAENLNRLAHAKAAARVLTLRRLLDRLEGQWLRELAAVDGRGAAGADHGTQADATAGWLRARLRAGHRQASGWVRTARALCRGPSPGTGRALLAGDLSPTHAAVLAAGTQDLPAATTAAAEPVLLEAAGRVDPPRLRKVITHLQQVADPEGSEARAERLHERRGLWVSAAMPGMVAIDGLLDPEAGETLLTALEPLARPACAEDERSGAQRRADALTELARRVLEGGWLGPLPTETVRRLACDATLTRAVITRHHDRERDAAAGGDTGSDADPGDLPARLRAAVALLPAALGGAPPARLDLGRATRVVAPAQHRALAVRDGGCRCPGCQRPPAWCEGHHRWHWLDGGWRLRRHPHGQLTAIPPPRQRPAAA